LHCIACDCGSLLTITAKNPYVPHGFWRFSRSEQHGFQPQNTLCNIKSGPLVTGTVSFLFLTILYKTNPTLYAIVKPLIPLAGFLV